MKLKFVGNPKDELTRKWGLKRFAIYEVEKVKRGGRVLALITLPKGNIVECPYQSENLFNKNWAIVL